MESEPAELANEGDEKVDSVFLQNDEQNATVVQQSLCSGAKGISDLEFGGNGDDGDMFLPSAIEDHPDAKSPASRNRRFRIYLCLAITTVVVGTVGAVLGITMTNEEVPPSVPYRATLGILENVARVVGNEQLDDHESAYRKALDWIMFADPAATTLDNPKFMQRYLLAYFYFATSVKKPWESGCAPATEEKVSCAFEVTFRRDGGFYNSTKTAFRWLSSVDECSWAGIHCDSSSQVQGIELGGNEMTGTFPEGIFLLPFLQYLRLSYGELEGPLPESLSKFKYFHDIELPSNAFTGTIPESWFKARSLKEVTLASNQISGTVSAKLLYLMDILTLVLDDNLLEGTIPNEIGNLMNIVELSANTNNLNGTIPRNVGKLPYIVSFDLSRNKVTGTIPTEIGMCRELVGISLHDNRLTGTIPDELWMAKELFLVSLGNNHLNGTISGQITTLSKLSELKIQDNQFTGNIPARLGRTAVEMIQASGNNFTGIVPDQICDLVGSGQLGQLELDCAVPPEGGAPEIICPCCTLCCTPNGKECNPTS